MHLDVVEIRDFYASALGARVRHQISMKIHQHWPSGDGLDLAGVGYASPYLRAFFKQSRQVAAFHPAGQGGLIWPAEGPLRSVIVDEDMFPLADDSFDRIIEIHGLEFFSDVEMHLKEVWRIMRPEGRLLLGNGQPFSRGQLRDLLIRSWFRPLSIEPLVHFAPFDTKLKLTASPAVERIGSKIWPRFSGMLMVDAIKEVAQPIRPKGLKASRMKTATIQVRPLPA